MEIFGFEISRKKDELRARGCTRHPLSLHQLRMMGHPSFNNSSGFMSGGAYGSYVDMEGGIKNEAELIRRYREISLVPECDSSN